LSGRSAVVLAKIETGSSPTPNAIPKRVMASLHPHRKARQKFPVRQRRSAWMDSCRGIIERSDLVQRSTRLAASPPPSAAAHAIPVKPLGHERPRLWANSHVARGLEFSDVPFPIRAPSDGQCCPLGAQYTVNEAVRFDDPGGIAGHTVVLFHALVYQILLRAERDDRAVSDGAATIELRQKSGAAQGLESLPFAFDQT
jgi:hypothetical protein